MNEASGTKVRERRTLMVSGRRTTVSLEQEIWRSLSDVADREHLALTRITDEVDRRREDASLASGLRVFCLYYWRILAESRAGAVNGPGFSELVDPAGLFHLAVEQMAKGGRHRARDASRGLRPRFGKPV